ncbi:hypothetical protein [Ideonella paludis]|uniref:Uncharacterized protein n=1 Tax=Ideonella paludis TaxID=1233411 RepID=A0ABS5E076_9BURK|nr:hypothetical protein [Ideonella paludis]MBQ0936796.1 hypothetical protein [Ideonella paludis]
MDTTTSRNAKPTLTWGLPQDRAAQLAARQAFVAMKRLFMDAVAPLGDGKGDWLRRQVRLANEPIDLWLLRGPVIAALRVDEHGSRELRAQLYHGLDNVFPEAFGLDGPMTLPPQMDSTAAWQPPQADLRVAA